MSSTPRSTRSTRRNVASAARLTLVAVAMFAIPTVAGLQPAGAAVRHAGSNDTVAQVRSLPIPNLPVINPCVFAGTCGGPVVIGPPLTIVGPPLTIVGPPVTLGPPPTIGPPVTIVDPPCIDKCTPPVPPCDTEGAKPCAKGDQPDPPTPPVEVDPPVVAHPNFTG